MRHREFCRIAEITTVPCADCESFVAVSRYRGGAAGRLWLPWGLQRRWRSARGSAGAVSSVGRASRLHRECRRFESVTAHHPPSCRQTAGPRRCAGASIAKWRRHGRPALKPAGLPEIVTAAARIGAVRQSRTPACAPRSAWLRPWCGESGYASTPGLPRQSATCGPPSCPETGGRTGAPRPDPANLGRNPATGAIPVDPKATRVILTTFRNSFSH